MICGKLGLKPGRTRHRDVPTLLLFYRKERPPRWPGPSLSPLSSPVAVFRPAPTSARTRTSFPIRVFCFCSFLCPGTYFHPPPPSLFLVEAPLLMAFGGNSSLHPRQNPSRCRSCQSTLLPLFWSIHHTVI